MAGASAILGSTISGEVGLRLLLCPLASNVVIRTACCTVGTILPVYSTFKAIERKDQSEQERWLVYWAAYGSFSLAEVFSDKILSWFPPYYYVKFAFLAWLQFPPYNGSRQLYSRHLRPLLMRHQARLDQVMGFVSSEIARFVNIHHAEIQFVHALLGRFLTAAHQMVKGVIHPVQPGQHAAIEDPGRQIQSGHAAIEGPGSQIQSGHAAIEDPGRQIQSGHAAIEGPGREIQGLESDHDD